MLLEATKEVLVKDVWLVALGDSFASGQGSPDAPLRDGEEGEAGWLDAACHRSRASWAYQVASPLQSKGSRRTHGVSRPTISCEKRSRRREFSSPSSPARAPAFATASSPTPPPVRSSLGACDDEDEDGDGDDAGVEGQLEVVAGIQAGSGVLPAAVLMSVGGNDMGISELLFALLWGSSGPLRASVPDRIAALERDFRDMAAFIAARISLRSPADVFLLEYYDIAFNERGKADASCGGLFAASDADLDYASAAILSPLNEQVARLASGYGWSFLPGVQVPLPPHPSSPYTGQSGWNRRLLESTATAAWTPSSCPWRRASGSRAPPTGPSIPTPPGTGPSPASSGPDSPKPSCPEPPIPPTHLLLPASL